MFKGKSVSGLSKLGYKTFVSFMFAAAVVAWGTTLLGLSPAGTREPSEIGLQRVSTLGWGILIVGSLFGVVLVCLYWVYFEYIAEHRLCAPRRVSVLVVPLDLLTLSLLVGAAAMWDQLIAFSWLAFGAVGALLLRCIISAVFEHSEAYLFRKRLMTQLGVLYLSVSVLGGFVVLGRWDANPGGALHLGDRLPYLAIVLGMLFGIPLVSVHAYRYKPDRDQQSDGGVMAALAAHPRVRSRLVSDYGFRPDEPSALVLRNVMAGEEDFAHIVEQSCGSRRCALHLSAVHSYRDVETQAVIVSHIATDPTLIRLRAMWVYMTHWFDDFFDSQCVDLIANEDLCEAFCIEDLLAKLDASADHHTRLRDVYLDAVSLSAGRLGGWPRREWMEWGFRRLILSGPMSSDRILNGNKYAESHSAMIQTLLNTCECDWLKPLINQCPPSYLGHTSKVVFEIWDSMEPHDTTQEWTLADSMLRNLLLVPGLLLHDYDSEREMAEVKAVDADNVRSLAATLDRVVEVVKSRPSVHRARLVRVLPMYRRCFAPVFDAAKVKTEVDLGETYDRLIQFALPSTNVEVKDLDSSPRPSA